MKPTILSVHSPDAATLETFEPSRREFSILLQLTIGPAGGSEGESFDMHVCSAAWICEQAMPMLGRHMLIVSNFNYVAIVAFIHTIVDSIEADTWQGVVDKLSRIAKWEFEDYQP